MRFHSSRLAFLAAAALTLSAATVAVAQDGPPPPGAPSAEHGHRGPGGPMMHHHRFDPEAHAQHLRDVLQLRPEQDGALKAYLAATGPQAWRKDRPERRPAEGPRKALTTPERLDRQVERMDRMTEALKARASATKTFYAALSPSQQKAFDALAPMGGRHGMMHRAGFRHGRGGPDGMAGQHKAG